MTYARIENGAIAAYPVYEGDIKLLFPHTSFPIPFTPPDGYELVVDTTPPTVDYTQVVTEGEPERIDGVLTRNWVVASASPELIAERTAAKAVSIRIERNNRLAVCDWTQLTDSPLDTTTKAAWATYRDELRAVPQQAGFPWDVVWPTEPGN